MVSFEKSDDCRTDSGLAHLIKRLALETGYVACGITTAEPFEDYARALAERMRLFPEAAGLYGEMLERVDPRAAAKWAKSIVVCLHWYGKYELPDRALGHIGRAYLADRRFEECPDHDMPARMKAGMKALGLRVRTGGAPCRPAAIRAGIAAQARNGFICSAEYGSWVNIECWLVDAELPADKPSDKCPCPDGCRACIDACPTGALVAPFRMRMDWCAAYLTYYAPLPVDPVLESKMGGWIYGCDACQEACPLNKGKWKNSERAEWMFKVAEHLALQALAGMTEGTYREIVHPRFSYIPVADLARWHANASRACRNCSKQDR